MTGATSFPHQRGATTVETPHLVGRIVIGGLLAGAIAGMAMAMWIMIAGATFGHTGFFSPMYLISAPFVGTGDAQRSLAAAGAGDVFVWSTGAALLGAAIHMANSMMFGVVFGAIARVLRLRAVAGVLVGMVYGLVLMVLMDAAVQPATDSLFGGGRYVTHIGSILGWGTWTVGHLIFGGMLGLWVALRPTDVGSDTTS